MNKIFKIAVVFLAVVVAVFALAHLPGLESIIRKIHGG
jgi:hypothetical protein